MKLKFFKKDLFSKVMFLLTAILSVTYILNDNFVSLLILYLFTGVIYLLTKNIIHSLLLAILLVSIFVSSGLLNFREGNTNKLCTNKCAKKWKTCLTSTDKNSGSFDNCFKNLLSGRNGFASDCSGNCILTRSMMEAAPSPWSPRLHKNYNEYSGGWDKDGSGRNSIELGKVTGATTDDDYAAWCYLRACPELNSQATSWCDGGGSNACKNECEEQRNCDKYKPQI